MTFRVSKVLLLLASLSAASVSGGDAKKCNATWRDCEHQIRQMLSGPRYLGLQVVELRPGFLVVKTVNDDGPARGKFEEGDRLMAVNGHSADKATVRDFKQMLAEARNPGTLWVIVQRRGALRRIDVRLQPYSKAQIDKIVSAHLAQSHSSPTAQR